MKHLRYFIILLFLIFVNKLTAQINMSEGFKFLEKGKFEKAKFFFEKILEKEPNNKTAKICYGRALGLTGSTKRATALFAELLQKYPNDFEVKLNYAESLLWGKKYTFAKEYYEKMIKEKPDSFNALLGYANTLSNLKKYKKALVFINKALEKSPGNNNALISRKYIRLGYADSLQKEKQSEKAITLLDDNLKDFSIDKESLQLKANIYLSNKEYKKATDVYLKIGKTEEGNITSLNGLSLIAHLEKKDKKALELAEKAMHKNAELKNVNLNKLTNERYVQALIWNKKYKLAAKKIKELHVNFPNQNWVLALDASQNIYKGGFKKAIELYKKILNNDTESFNGNLGITNAYLANNDYTNAFKSIKEALVLFPTQKDAVSIEKKMYRKFFPYLEEKISYSFDNGDNTSYTSSTSVVYPLNKKLTLNGLFTYRKTGNSQLNTKANSIGFNLGLNYQVIPNLNFISNIGYSDVKAISNNYNQTVFTVKIKSKPFRLHDLEMGFNRRLEDFNVDLLNRKIVNDNYFINYNIGTTFNLGWYNQFFLTNLSDGNQRSLFFSSLYYNFLSEPLIKGGINYQYITFSTQKPTVYFSPEKFNNYEVFIELLKDEQSTRKKNWFYNANAATGIQKIETNDGQFTYRINAKLGYKFSDNFLMNVYGSHTNIASATVAGFTFTELGLRLKWYFNNRLIK